MPIARVAAAAPAWGCMKLSKDHTAQAFPWARYGALSVTQGLSCVQFSHVHTYCCLTIISTTMICHHLCA